MKRAALYMRVSTKRQKVDLQRDALLEFVANSGYSITREYIDTGISGAKKDRPELEQLKKDAHLHKFDMILVWKFDRFARSLIHLLQSLEQFNHLNIAFVSITEGVDTSSPTGKAMLSVFGLIAEMERGFIKERISAGMESARNRGITLGRPFTDPVIVQEIEKLSVETDMSINAIREAIGTKLVSRAVVGKLVKAKRDKTADV